MSTNTALPETASFSGGSRRFGDLRGVQWRVDLGILPSSPSASIDDLRRVTANSRRRYAALRRRLLVDPHVPKDGNTSPDLVMDNPLSQNPDSMWGRFFRSAELERTLDQDLTRLYPERGSYFQTSGCQAMLRRILLLWCLRNPEYGYRQGMHELLAPLLYVLHVDVERLSEVRKNYDDHFVDKFDGFSFHENDLTYKFDFKKFSESSEDDKRFENGSSKPSNLGELDQEIQTIVLLSDAYGAEGELGIVLSEKFIEHDAYSMFDSLMSGPSSGALAMAEFFSPSVIEASAALYHLLSNVDSSLHTHLVELGVEPQYFALRWLRVLFGREFSLEDLLLIWDEIFAYENINSNKYDAESNFGVLESPRGAFICAFAVSMILNLRSSLLATENATACLQRLLNFPDDIKLAKLLTKAKSLHPLALDANNSISVPIRSGIYDDKKSTVTRSHTVSLDLTSTSPKTPLTVVPDSYWEEKWRVLHEEEEQKKGLAGEQVPNRIKGWSEKVRLRLSRTESDPSPSSSNKNARTKIPKPSVRRSLLNDLARQLGAEEEDVGPLISVEVDEQNVADEKNRDSSANEESCSNSSDQTTRVRSDNENESGRSSVASNSLADENEDAESSSVNIPVCSAAPPPVSDPTDDVPAECTVDDESVGKLETGVKERKLLAGKFQWLWKFGRSGGSEGTSERSGGGEDTAKASCNGEEKDVISVSSTGKGKTVDQNLMVNLKNVGQSMLENIQVIESVFQQDRGQAGSVDNLSKNGGIVGKGQVTAMAALKELRKISNLLSEM
ncbi:hypothetical protein ABFS82_10G070600 [Erythranthe guttata]|uniref:Rab-GAP TBC domain-containing protein n=1 Tax=Erythranthe guttata TaxID=4155 RepID=A0A022PPI0_ERYGU|nr:PREDICTED: TBC1 domain family member 5 homolog B-like [Erythranthe guttata]EYU18222.1 hypothetical protein MIMGU_mgv1a001607mg [Erythranthe guttata]|eukprot:XP_012828740.1 PREDICTED: TBC1 domain family member 5 homolog B-like [Erythranthe guttata]